MSGSCLASLASRPNSEALRIPGEAITQTCTLDQVLPNRFCPIFAIAQVRFALDAKPAGQAKYGKRISRSWQVPRWLHQGGISLPRRNMAL
jgi:hypothetical protein